MESNESLGVDEVAEIEKHKYFLSEKAGHDVGWEFAAKDWQTKYGSVEEAADSEAASEQSVRRDLAEKPRPSKGLAAILKRFLPGNKAAV